LQSLEQSSFDRGLVSSNLNQSLSEELNAEKCSSCKMAIKEEPIAVGRVECRKVQ